MEFELLASGYEIIEGPRVDAHDRLYFSDAGDNGGVYRRNPDGAIETLIAGRDRVGGIALNAGGGLVVSGRGLIFWDEASGGSRDLFTHWEGRKINVFNDLTPDSQGSIITGSIEYDAIRGEAPVPGALYRVDPPGVGHLLWEGVQVSNGLGFSPDGKLLYLADTATQAIWAFDVTSDRGLKDRRMFAKLPAGLPDGLAVDAEGGVWVAAVLGREVVRFSNDGAIDRRIPIPARNVTSVVFGGADLQDLYVVTCFDQDNRNEKGSIFRTRSDIPGLPVPNARF
jgi:xylono-1,5-lactonase